MSGGAKAGLAFGIIFALAALAFLVLFCYRRKKRHSKMHQKLGDEKSAYQQQQQQQLKQPQPVMPAAPPLIGTSLRSTESLNAPRLSLRPVTEFSPNFMGSNTRSSNLGAVADAGVSSQDGSRGLRPASASAWERRGEQHHANNPNNPFGNHAETVELQPTAQASQLAPTLPNVELAPVATVAGATAAAETAASRPASDGVTPKPLSIKSHKTSASAVSAISANTDEGSISQATAAVPVAANAAAGGAVAGAGPPGSPTGALNVHRVQLDFKPSMEDELELRAGALVRLLHEYDDGWVIRSLCKLSGSPTDRCRRFAFAWTAPSKVSSLVLASRNIQSSLVPVRRQVVHKALLRCVVLQ